MAAGVKWPSSLHIFQPFEGGTRFILWQGLGWTVLSTSLLSQAVAYCISRHHDSAFLGDARYWSCPARNTRALALHSSCWISFILASNFLLTSLGMIPRVPRSVSTGPCKSLESTRSSVACSLSGHLLFGLLQAARSIALGSLHG